MKTTKRKRETSGQEDQREGSSRSRAREQRSGERGTEEKGRQPDRPPWWKSRAFSWGWQILAFLVLLFLVNEWQSRGLLSRRSEAPAFELTAIDGGRYSLADARGKTVVLYFFAPWCSVCRVTSANVEALRQRRSERDVVIYAIGLGWRRRAEVEQFAREHHLTMPVLLGNEQVLRDYHINVFPTIYVIDADGKVRDRVVGYTTEAGLLLRSL